MPRQRKLLSLLYSGEQRHKSWLKTLILVSGFSVLFFYIAHIFITLSNKTPLDNYANAVFEKSKQLDFQIKSSFLLASNNESAFCSEHDFQKLRDTLDKYYYLDDLGRVENGKIICTVKKGLLEEPIRLIGKETISESGVHFWNNQNKLFNDAKRPPIATTKDTASFISPAFLADLESNIPISNGSGGYFFLKNSDYLFKIYGKIDVNDIPKIRLEQPSLASWLLLPGSRSSNQLCDKRSDICLMTVVTATGLSNLSYLYFFIAIFMTLSLSILSAILIFNLQIGPNAFVRKLKSAIKTDKIYPVYQTKIIVSNGNVTGVESLARWNDPSLGFISPDLFISVAEETGLIKPLTESFIKKTFIELKDILEKRPDFTLSINVSADVLIDENFISFLKLEAEKYQFNTNQIILEITERISSNSSSMAEAAAISKKEGFQVSLDDFGTGYSNLAWLTNVEPDEIKIDKMFTQAVGTETVNSITLNGMFSMLDHLDVSVVFEGIETKQQMEYIKQRVPEAIGQGWYFSKPVPVDDLLSSLK